MIVHEHVLPSERETCDDDGGLHFSPPASLAPGPDHRLHPRLRDAARTRNGVELLVRATEAFYMLRHAPDSGALSDVGDLRGYARALADLAVTGRGAWARLRSTNPGIDLLTTQVRPRLASRYRAALLDADLRASAEDALERARRVAWALRGPPGWRVLSRRPLRWIATSGEDDVSHRPVNVPSAAWPQFDLTVRVGGIDVQTRYMVASQGVDPTRYDISEVDLNTLPPEPTPSVPDGHEVLLYLHGHSSRLEEALDLTPRLHDAGRRTGQRFTVISVDLPSSGYASHIDPERIAPAAASGYHLAGDGGYPILDFIEEFVVQFVDALHRHVPVRDRIAAVIGGSLGGNLVLRLGERQPRPPWLNALVSWSPASVWDPVLGEPAKDEVHTVPKEEMVEPETDAQRRDYFKNVFEGFFRFFPIPPQTNSWYRDGWPCKQAYIDGARRDRYEIYSAAFRRWHWRVAYEQLLFSHRSPVRRGERPRFHGIRTRLLLLAGEADDDHFLEIHDATKSMAEAMIDTPGEAFLLRDTGHSIHNERPVLLANRIAEFLHAEAHGRSLAEATWAHGYDVEVEHEDRVERITRVGSAGRVVGRAGQATWLHFAVPTPVISEDRRLRMGSVLLRFRSGSGATVTAVHIYDGEKRKVARNGLSEQSDAWKLVRIDVPEAPEVRWGVGISIQVAFANGGGRQIDVAAVGGDFLS